MPKLEAAEAGARSTELGRQALEFVLFSPWGHRKPLSWAVTGSDLLCKKISWTSGGACIKANLERKNLEENLVHIFGGENERSWRCVRDGGKRTKLRYIKLEIIGLDGLKVQWGGGGDEIPFDFWVVA